MASTDRRFGLTSGLAIKAPVRAATTGAITLSGLQTVDGVVLATNDRVLVKNQADTTANGIYAASTAAWTRDIDANGNLDFVKGSTVLVTDGSTQAGVYYQITSANPITIGTTAITWGLALTAGVSTLSFTQTGTGAVVRSALSKMRDALSVYDFGAVGDGVTDDTTAIQSAITAAGLVGKAVFFPAPASYYKITTALNVGYSPHLFGEQGPSTIIRNTAGGAVLNFAATNENSVVENLRIGGTGTLVQVNGGGYANYLSTLSLRNVHFESDATVCINANLIHCNFIDCTFGYFTSAGANANLQHIVSSFSGGNNTNINKLENCKFFNGGTTQVSVTFTGGLILSFIDCAWENNGADLSTSNVQNCALMNCYSERGKHASGQFNFGATRVRTKVIGGQFNGSANMPAGASMFRASEAGSLLVEDADISTTAAAFTYQDTTSSLHSLPASGVHHFKDCRVQGNAADPLLWMDNILEDTAVAWTPVPTSLTVVNGTGGATYSGTWSIRGRQVYWTIKITTTGTCTTASTAGATFFQFPSQFVPSANSTGGVTNEVSGASLGVGLAYLSGRFFPPAWAAQAGNVTMSGSFSF